MKNLSKHYQKFVDNPGGSIATAVAVTAVGLFTREAVENVWRLVDGEEPPRNPARSDVDWKTAITWTTAVGVAVGLARLATRRFMEDDPEN